MNKDSTLFIGISGKPKVGKNYLAEDLKDFFEYHGYKAGLLSFARPLKEVLSRFLNINPDDFDRDDVKDRIIEATGKNYREALTDIFYSFEKNLGPEYPCPFLDQRIEESPDINVWICYDVRQIYQVNYILKKKGIVFRLDKDESWQKTEVDNRPIESMLDNFDKFTDRYSVDFQHKNYQDILEKIKLNFLIAAKR